MTSTEKLIAEALRSMNAQEIKAYRDMLVAIPDQAYYDALRLHVAERIKLGRPLERKEINRLVGALFDRRNAEANRKAREVELANERIWEISPGAWL